MMSVAGFTSGMIEAVRYLRCQICERIAAPSANPRVIEKRSTNFNKLIGTDASVILSCDSEAEFQCLRFVGAFNIWPMGDLPQDSSERISLDFVADTFSPSWVGLVGQLMEVLQCCTTKIRITAV